MSHLCQDLHHLMEVLEAAAAAATAVPMANVILNVQYFPFAFFIKNDLLLAYAPENHDASYYNIPETNYASYDAKPAVVLSSYGPPKVSHEYGPAKPTYSYVQDPHSGYGAPGDFGKKNAKEFVY